MSCVTHILRTSSLLTCCRALLSFPVPPSHTRGLNSLRYENNRAELELGAKDNKQLDAALTSAHGGRSRFAHSENGSMNRI
jgi:hypothetical protein